MWILRRGKPLFQGILPFLTVIGKLSQQILGALRLLLDGAFNQRAQVFLALEDSSKKGVWLCLVWSNAGHLRRRFVYFADVQAFRVRADDSLNKFVIGCLVSRIKLAKELMVLEESRPFRDVVGAVGKELKGAELGNDGVHVSRLSEIKTSATAPFYDFIFATKDVRSGFVSPQVNGFPANLYLVGFAILAGGDNYPVQRRLG